MWPRAGSRCRAELHGSMNILQIVSASRTGGVERHVVVLSEILRQRGHNVTGGLSARRVAAGATARGRAFP